ncbi:MAG: type II toxin-antitoxin system RelE/ParE family toxin [Candidatus Nanoarchaeia archaeon]|nr:type II toxin-antitoxin system RelE/ParE family toxin [Candidatus Nanoarchaeia archaeon]
MLVRFVEYIKTDLKKYNLHATYLKKIEEKLIANSDRITKISQELHGFKPLRKLRLGDYRLFFFIEAGTLVCIALKHRKEAYDNVGNLFKRV